MDINFDTFSSLCKSVSSAISLYENILSLADRTNYSHMLADNADRVLTSTAKYVIDYLPNNDKDTRKFLEDLTAKKFDNQLQLFTSLYYESYRYFGHIYKALDCLGYDLYCVNKLDVWKVNILCYIYNDWEVVERYCLILGIIDNASEDYAEFLYEEEFNDD